MAFPGLPELRSMLFTDLLRLGSACTLSFRVSSGFLGGSLVAPKQPS